jgi:hypothetical protein
MATLPDTHARREALARADALMTRIEDAEHEQNLTRAAQVAMFADGIASLSRRLDAFEHRRAEQARRDAEEEEREEQERIAAVLDELPDPDNPDPFAPSGDLHALPASEPEDKLQLAAIEGDDEYPGDLPPSLLKDAPPDPGDNPIEDPDELGHSAWPPKNVQAQPIAVSLNEDD